MMETKFITEEEFFHSRPHGSQPSRLYGLPKIHKIGQPLRPILSASGSFNYGIAKLLVKRLSHLQTHHTIIDDTFKFVDELHSLDFNMNDHKLISFDVINLFTMVPLKETIEIILKKLYNDLCNCQTTKKKKTTSETCSNCSNRNNMEWLLKTATEQTHFHFNGSIYIQHEGVSMGSPLGPLLANIFLIELEKNKMEELENHGVVYYRRYVDDTFTIVKKNADVNKILHILNSFHQDIRFTAEEKNDVFLPFLDVKIIPKTTKNTSWFSTTIYRKDTFTGLILKYSSFVPHCYKRSAISSMIYRAIRICSNFFLLHDEFNTIKEIATGNGYPLPFVENLIRKTLNLYYQQKEKPKKEKQHEQQRKPLLIDIQYVPRSKKTDPYTDR